MFTCTVLNWYKYTYYAIKNNTWNAFNMWVFIHKGYIGEQFRRILENSGH